MIINYRVYKIQNKHKLIQTSIYKHSTWYIVTEFIAHVVGKKRGDKKIFHGCPNLSVNQSQEVDVVT